MIAAAKEALWIVGAFLLATTLIFTWFVVAATVDMTSLARKVCQLIWLTVNPNGGCHGAEPKL